MNPEERLTITCEADGQKTSGFVMRRDFSRDERMLRSARVLGILWVIGLFSIVVPVLHFILPPLFLIAGVVFATTTWMETAEVIGGEIACPNCKQILNFQREAEEWPKIQRCGGCSYMLTINRA